MVYFLMRRGYAGVSFYATGPGEVVSVRLNGRVSENLSYLGYLILNECQQMIESGEALKYALFDSGAGMRYHDEQPWEFLDKGKSFIGLVVPKGIYCVFDNEYKPLVVDEANLPVGLKIQDPLFDNSPKKAPVVKLADFRK